MKKILLWIFIFIMVCFTSLAVFTVEIKADEVEPQTELTEEENETLTEIVDYVSQYVDRNLVMNIINWLLDCGFLTALLGVLIKYKKYKNYTASELIELFKEEIQKYIEDNFDKLSKEQITGIVDKLNNLDKSNETIMKVLVLMSDNSEKGRIALIDYLGSKTESKEVKEAGNEIKAELEEKIEKQEELKAKANADYVNIF